MRQPQSLMIAWATRGTDTIPVPWVASNIARAHSRRPLNQVLPAQAGGRLVQRPRCAIQLPDRPAKQVGARVGMVHLLEILSGLEVRIVVGIGATVQDRAGGDTPGLHLLGRLVSVAGCSPPIPYLILGFPIFPTLPHGVGLFSFYSIRTVIPSPKCLPRPAWTPL